jgi:hypothetical protein
MTYWTALFSLDTHARFSRSDGTVAGFPVGKRTGVVQPGDKLVCYLTRVGRWTGILEVESSAYQDTTPIFAEKADPYTNRFRVRPIVWLQPDEAIPIREPEIWQRLSFTRGHKVGSISWTGKIRASLTKLSDSDGRFLETALQKRLGKPGR